MPTYDYYCSECQHEMETFQKITDEALKKCPKCQKDALIRRPGGGVGLSFSGDGFYSTMYGPKKSEGEGGCCPCGKKKGSCNQE